MKGSICGNTLIATSEIHKSKQKPDSNDRTLNDISFAIEIHLGKTKLWKTRAIEIVSYVVCIGKANSNIEFALCIIGYESSAIYIFLLFLLLCPEFHVRKYIFSSWLLCCAFYSVHKARYDVNDRIYLLPQNASRRNGCHWLHRNTQAMPPEPVPFPNRVLWENRIHSIRLPTTTCNQLHPKKSRKESTRWLDHRVEVLARKIIHSKIVRYMKMLHWMCTRNVAQRASASLALSLVALVCLVVAIKCSS